MNFGVAMFVTDETADPATVARMVEQRGFESLFVPEHTHIPASRLTSYPVGGELPREYRRTFDPFVALTAAAMVTEHLRLATGICLVIQRDPITTAKEVASLDLLSGGRFLFGVGAGWNEEEMRNHGTDPRLRFVLMHERVEAMKAIWTQDEASYRGRFVDFEAIWSWPRPVQKPHPPVLVAGHGPRVLERVVRFGDEWYPNRIRDGDLLRARIAELQALARDAGRGPIPVTLGVAPKDPAEIERYAEAGVHRFVRYVPPAQADQVERSLDDYAALLEKVA